jgi:hypothetical protein
LNLIQLILALSFPSSHVKRRRPQFPGEVGVWSL